MTAEGVQQQASSSAAETTHVSPTRPHRPSDFQSVRKSGLLPQVPSRAQIAINITRHSCTMARVPLKRPQIRRWINRLQWHRRRGLRRISFAMVAGGGASTRITILPTIGCESPSFVTTPHLCLPLLYFKVSIPSSGVFARKPVNVVVRCERS